MKQELESHARHRLRASDQNIAYALEMIRRGNPLAAEPSQTRRRGRLQTKKGLRPAEAEAIDRDVRERAQPLAPGAEAPPAGPTTAVVRPDRREKIRGDTLDFVSVAFLEKGARIARSVGRVAFPGGDPQGTGVLIGEGLFLTNHHVIRSAFEADMFLLEFDYERDLRGRLRETTRFRLDPSVFITDPVEGLDFTVIGIGGREDGAATLAELGYSGLSAAPDKHMLGEFANIVQHPSGRLKEVVLRENRLINRFEDALHYVADTQPGSSGSPVYNSEWQMIALHHWGGPWIEGRPDDADSEIEINEGIRTSRIVRALRGRLPGLPEAARRRVAKAIDLGERDWRRAERAPEIRTAPAPGAGAEDSARVSAGAPRIDADGRASWTIPVEVSVQIPQLAGAVGPASAPAVAAPARAPGATATAESERDDYSDRDGYRPDFLEGFEIPLPELGPGIRDDAAPLIDPAPGAPPFELKYHHFSVVVNKRRKLAFFAACCIDGASAKSIRRSDKTVSDLSASDPGLREAIRALDEAEGDSWHRDPRIDRRHYSGDEIYESQKVPNFPTHGSGRLRRMFQKGHLVRRLDPVWGEERIALLAELDTFHWTNAAPQVGFFNMGKADEDQPGTGGGKLWRAAENYVLRNAVAENQRVISFTGPVFAEDDRPYRDIRIPARFFKVTVWVEDGALCSLALLVDQSQVFREWPEAIGTAEFALTASEAEAFQDADELDRVQDFLSTVEEVEALTELDFGDTVRSADIRAGSERHEVRGDADLPLGADGNGGAARRGPRIAGALDQPDGEPDDLTAIRGIGPALARMLNREGVFHFRQIAAWGPREIAQIDDLLRFSGRIERDQWVEQAADLARGR